MIRNRLLVFGIAFICAYLPVVSSAEVRKYEVGGICQTPILEDEARAGEHIGIVAERIGKAAGRKVTVSDVEANPLFGNNFCDHDKFRTPTTTAYEDDPVCYVS
tara:strand:+ start:184 stop:495 length:312 start_codon:yes stop_codon:yes gene_type:complete